MNHRFSQMAQIEARRDGLSAIAQISAYLCESVVN